MRVILSPSYELSTEHAASRYGQPVLVHRSTGEAYGPGDILKAYANYDWMPASRVVQRLAKAVHLTAEGQALVDRFVGLAPPAA